MQKMRLGHQIRKDAENRGVFGSVFPSMDENGKMISLSESFENSYLPRIKEFVANVACTDVSGIPEPHLPLWGTEYDIAPVKIGIIGRDTRGWGTLSNFIDAVNVDPPKALYRGKEEFDSFDFVGWTNNFGTSFWDTSLRILAGIYGINDWKRLKRLETIDPLKRFFWANANSVERFEVSPQKNKVPWDNWHKVKVASEKHIDSFRQILDVFRPHFVFILNWEPGERFLDFPIDWTHFGKYQAEAVDPTTGSLILITAHPTWLNQNGLYNEAIDGVIRRARMELENFSATVINNKS